MKKALALALAALIVAFAFAAYAGPYFVIETDVFNLNTAIDIGWDGGEVGEGRVVYWELWGSFVTQTPSFTIGADLTIDGAILCLDVGTSWALDYNAWPNVPLNTTLWTGSAKVSVNLGGATVMWGSGVLTYAPGGSPWSLAPTVGIECRW